MFRSSDGRDQLTITTLPLKSGASEPDPQQTLQALVEHRHAAETRAMGSKATFSEPRPGSKDGVYFTQYSGTDPAAGHRFATLVLCSDKGAWVFFLESAETSPDVFETKVHAIFDTVEVAR